MKHVYCCVITDSMCFGILKEEFNFILRCGNSRGVYFGKEGQECMLTTVLYVDGGNAYEKTHELYVGLEEYKDAAAIDELPEFHTFNQFADYK